MPELRDPPGDEETAHRTERRPEAREDRPGPKLNRFLDRSCCVYCAIDTGIATSVAAGRNICARQRGTGAPSGRTLPRNQTERRCALRRTADRWS